MNHTDEGHLTFRQDPATTAKALQLHFAVKRKKS